MNEYKLINKIAKEEHDERERKRRRSKYPTSCKK